MSMSNAYSITVLGKFILEGQLIGKLPPIDKVKRVWSGIFLIYRWN